MDTILSPQILELLDRKYAFVIESSVRTFMLDLQQFVDFITQNQFIRDFTFKIMTEFKGKHDLYQERLNKEEAKLIEIKNDIISTYPELNDADLESPPLPADPFNHLLSFAHFDDIVKRTERILFSPIESNTMDDNSNVGELIEILNIKIGDYEGLDQRRQLDDVIKERLRNVEDDHLYTRRDWVNTCRVSAGHELNYLISIVQRINPPPKQKQSIKEMTHREIFRLGLDALHEKKSYSFVRDLSYGVVSNYADDHPNNLDDQQRERIIASLKESLKRVYVAIRQEVGTTQLYVQLINRYRLRCQWYNQNHLRRLVEKPSGQYERTREDLLTKDLALFLFDQGVTVLYRVRFGKHEVDLLQVDAPDPIFVEAKVYKDSKARRELVDGIAQLHSYLCNLEGFKSIREAYYIIYHLGGPIYELPSKIATNRFIIYPILIDLGLSKESGRKQAKPRIIGQEDLLSKIVEDSRA